MSDEIMPSITVYSSSSAKLAPVYYEAGQRLGCAIARRGWSLVYGGNCIGLMDTLACAARKSGGQVIGITPRLMVEEGIADMQCDELVITDTMRERKALLEQRGDGFIALPGGLGTLEEIFEVIVSRSLGYHAKPIVLLNINDYYDPMLTMIEHGIEQAFIRPKVRSLWHATSDIDDALNYIADHLADRPAGPESADPTIIAE